MNPIGRWLLRITVLAYAALLIAGAWPYQAVPLVGPASAWASYALGLVSVRPGMPIFNAGEPRPVEWKLHALCQRLVGVRADGREEPLYDGACPAPGPRIGTAPLEALLQRLGRATSEPRLLARSASGEVDHRSRDARRFIALGDWACRTGSGRFRSVQLVQQRQFQSYATGAYRAAPVLECTWYCDEHPAPRARCERLPPDADAALVEDPALAADAVRVEAEP